MPLSKDLFQFVESLKKNEDEYLMVGAFAVAWYARVSPVYWRYRLFCATSTCGRGGGYPCPADVRIWESANNRRGLEPNQQGDPDWLSTESH